MSTLNFTIGTVTDRGLNSRRTANEDRLLVLPDNGLFLVADGVGGHRGGQVASQTAVDIFTAAFQTHGAEDLFALVNFTIKQANRAIIQTAAADQELAGMASTLALVAVDASRAVIAHVGDSRVYRFDGKNLLSETEDHSEVNDAVRAGKMSAAEAENHPHRNIISRALGADAEVEPEFKIVTIDDRTSFLLCSDGITRHIPDHELERLMQSGQHPDFICARMKEICFARGAEDNLTAVIIDCGTRTYADELTRPVIGKPSVTTPPSPGNAASRISVDLSNPLMADATVEVATAAAPPQKVKTKSSSQKKSYLGAIVQLIILAGLLAGIFYVGRNWEQVKNFVMGTSTTTPNNAANAISPNLQNPEFGAAMVLFTERRYDKAREAFQKLIEKDATNAEYKYWLGRSYLELQNYPEAIKNLNEAAQRDEKLPNIFVHLSLAYTRSGDKKNAEESMKRAASLTPSPAPAPATSPTPAG